jgi:hypothetical protein
MFGDFFVSNHFKLEQLNFRQLTDLIIETRKDRIAERDQSGKSARSESKEQAESARIRHEQKKLDSIKAHKERIALSNKLAESVTFSNENHDKILERVQKTMEAFYAKKNFKHKDQDREFEENDTVRKTAQHNSEIYTDEKRASKKQVVTDNVERMSERKGLEAEYIETSGSKRQAHRDDVKARRDDLKEKEAERKENNQESLKNIDQTPVEPGVNKSKSLEDKAARVERARERNAANKASVDDPYEKNAEIMARKEKTLNDSRERKAPKDELFTESHKALFERLKDRIDAAYTRGDINREEKAALVEKAQTITADRRMEGFEHRWRRYAVNMKWESPPLDKLSMRLFNFLNELWLTDQSPNRADDLEHGNPRSPVMHELYRIFTPLIDKERETVDPAVRDLLEVDPWVRIHGEADPQVRNNGEVAPQAPKGPDHDKDILHEPAESTLLFEKHIEDCIKNNMKYRESLQKEDLIIYLDNMETRHPDEKSMKATDRSSLSSPFKNPNLVFKDIMTYVDDTDKLEADKARDIEDEITRNAAYIEEVEKDLLKKMNGEKRQRDELMAEERMAALRKYYAELIEDQNKSAHEKAVELGQFINLFF